MFTISCSKSICSIRSGLSSFFLFVFLFLMFFISLFFSFLICCLFAWPFYSRSAAAKLGGLRRPRPPCLLVCRFCLLFWFFVLFLLFCVCVCVAWLVLLFLLCFVVAFVDVLGFCFMVSLVVLFVVVLLLFLCCCFCFCVFCVYHVQTQYVQSDRGYIHCFYLYFLCGCFWFWRVVVFF